MAPLSEKAIEFLRDNAKDKVDERFSPRDFFDMYAAMPEFAGRELQNLLAAMPEAAPNVKNPAVVNAFFAEYMLKKTQEDLANLLAEDKHMDAISKDADPGLDWRRSLKGDVPGVSERDITASARDAGQGVPDADRQISRESGKNDDAVSESFRDALKNPNPPEEKTKKADDDDDDEMDDLVEEAPDFSRQDPASCFTNSTRLLVDRILMKCTGGKSFSKLRPLFNEALATKQEIRSLCNDIWSKVNRLRWRGGDGRDRELQY